MNFKFFGGATSAQAAPQNLWHSYLCLWFSGYDIKRFYSTVGRTFNDDSCWICINTVFWRRKNLSQKRRNRLLDDDSLTNMRTLEKERVRSAGHCTEKVNELVCKIYPDHLSEYHTMRSETTFGCSLMLRVTKIQTV